MANWGGIREGAGRPKGDRSCAISVRISKEAFEKLSAITRNKSEFIEKLILEYQP